MKEEKEKEPVNCCNHDETIQASALKEVIKLENYTIARNSAIIEAEGYCKWSRLEETIIFAKRCGYKKLGLAFCVGLIKEANIISKIFKSFDFNVVSVVCKNGSIDKAELDLTRDQQIDKESYEPMCNPIGQAMLMNKEDTDFNIVIGLCVGHDTLFMKYSKAPITVLAAKDRVTGHNPLVPIYLYESYYKKKIEILKELLKEN